MAVRLARHRFTVSDYEQMAAAGILGEDDRIELIEGEIIDMSPIGIDHMTCVNRLNRLLTRAVENRAIVSVQNPVRLSDLSEPQPDVALLHNREYDTIPSPDDVFLLIEVADTTLAYDQGVKIPLYARAGIREVWLVDLSSRAVIRYAEPADGDYQQVERFRKDAHITVSALPDVSIAVDDVFARFPETDRGRSQTTW